MVSDAVTADEARERFTWQSLTTICICALVYCLDGVVHSILGPLAPEISRTLGISNAELGPIFSANLIGQCGGLIIFPFLANRYGHRPVVIAAIVGFGLGQCASALADGGTSLFMWRLVTGVFLGGCLPSCLAVVTAVAPTKRRGFAVTMLFTGYGLGATVAGVLATGFAALGGWRLAMAAVGVLCLAAAALAWLWLQELKTDTEEDAAEGKAARKAHPLEILSKRYVIGTLMLWTLFISMLTISYCLVSWLPVLLVEVGRDESFAGLSISIFSLGGIVAALGVGLLIDRLGALRVLITFLVIATIMLFAIGQVIASAPPGTLMVMLAVGGFFFLGAYGGVNVVLATYYPPSLRATGIGWTKSVGRVGTVLAPVLIGLGLTAGMAETTIMSLFAAPAFLAVMSLVVIGLARQRPKPVRRSS